MDIDAMAIHVRRLMAFRDKHEPMLEEMAKAKAAHEQRQVMLSQPQVFSTPPEPLVEPDQDVHSGP